MIKIAMMTVCVCVLGACGSDDADENALPGVNPAETTARQRTSANGNDLIAVILEQDQIVIAKSEQTIRFA